MPRLELRDGTRQQVAGQRFGRGDAHLSAHQSAQAFDLVAHRLQVAERAPHVGGEHFAGRREAHAARQAFEQRRAQFFFQIEDLPVQRGRGKVQRVRRLANRAVAHDGIDIEQDAGRPDDVPGRGFGCQGRSGGRGFGGSTAPGLGWGHGEMIASGGRYRPTEPRPPRILYTGTNPGQPMFSTLQDLSRNSPPAPPGMPPPTASTRCGSRRRCCWSK